MSRARVDYVRSISKCRDRPVRTLLHKVANARRSTMREARIALAGRRAIIMHAMLRDEIEFAPA
jgi:transposase